MADSSLSIVIVTLSDLPQGGGNTTRLARLVDALGRLGHRVSIWNEHALGVAPPDALAATGTLSGAPFAYALGATERGSGFGMIQTKLAAVKRLGGWVHQRHARRDLDVLWFNNLSFYDQYPLTRIAKRLGIPTVQSYEDERLELVSDAPQTLSRRLFAWNSRLADRHCPALADAIVTISHYLYDKYSASFQSSDTVHLIPTIIDCAAWDCGAEVEQAEPTLLYAGAFGEQDEIENILRAFAQLHAEGRHFKAVMLGGNARDPEPLTQARQLVLSLGLSDRVVFPGFVSSQKVKEHIEESAIVLNIRRDGIWSRSGLSTKLSEYLASGRLVVGSTVGEVEHYLTDKENALLVSPAVSVREIADQLRQGLDSPAARRKIGRAGREVALRHFDVPVVMEKLRVLLQKICPRGGSK